MAVNQQIRQRKATVASNLPEDVEPIDEDEQASIVTSLEGEQAAQEKLGKLCLGGILALVCFLHGHLAYCQVSRPWSTKQAAYFIDVPASLVASGFSASSASYLLALRRLSGVQWPFTDGLSSLPDVAIAILTSVLWSCILISAVNARDEGWLPALKFWWLPIGPVAIVWLVEHVLRMFQGSKHDLDKLRTEMYPFKTA